MMLRIKSFILIVSNLSRGKGRGKEAPTLQNSSHTHAIHTLRVAGILQFHFHALNFYVTKEEKYYNNKINKHFIYV